MEITRELTNTICAAYSAMNRDVLHRDELFEYVRAVYPHLRQDELGMVIAAVCVNNSHRTRYIPIVHDAWLDVLFRAKGTTMKNSMYILYDDSSFSEYIADDELACCSRKKKRELKITNRIDGTPLFPSEAHLRDFVVKNTHLIRINGAHLVPYVDDFGRIGVEYQTGVGIIDYLSIDYDGNFYIFEFKLHRGIDSALGQLCRYMGWVRSHLAKAKRVYGIIVAEKFDIKLQYACSVVPDVFLYEYHLSYSVMPVSLNTVAL